MSELLFPEGFLWGTATSGHQTEGGNSNSDWWDWELKPSTPVKEPSGNAIEHYTRYPKDFELLGGLGFNMCRFGIEWCRVEPEEGRFDEAQIEHYRKMIAASRASGMAPMVTLNHFTLPRWVAAQGGWLSEKTPVLFDRYVRRVVEALGDHVDWWITINEPGVVAFGGYLGALGFPPGLHTVSDWKASIKQLIRGHRLSLATIKELRPRAQAGVAHSMQEWESNWGGRAVIDYGRRWNEDVFLEACTDDDFVGVNTYTRTRLDFNPLFGVASRVALAVPALERRIVPRVVEQLRDVEGPEAFGQAAFRKTDMGYEWRPTAAAACVRRVAGLFPGKPILATEHGVATGNDEERIEFIRDGLVALHQLIDEGIPLGGYIYWSGFDNFEWALGYSMKFGLVAVDPATQVRDVRPSARYLGDIARSNKLVVG